jgi:hypothetical protein
MFLTANDDTRLPSDAVEMGGVFELRTYVAQPGQLAALRAHFRDHATPLFEKHGMKNVGYWTPFDTPEANDTLICLLRHASRQQAAANWQAFHRDPALQRVAGSLQIKGDLLARPPESIYLNATRFSPLK